MSFGPGVFLLQIFLALGPRCQPQPRWHMLLVSLPPCRSSAEYRSRRTGLPPFVSCPSVWPPWPLHWALPVGICVPAPHGVCVGTAWYVLGCVVFYASDGRCGSDGRPLRSTTVRIDPLDAWSVACRPASLWILFVTTRPPANFMLANGIEDGNLRAS